MKAWLRQRSKEVCGAKTCVVQAEGQCRAGQLLAGLGLDISLPGIRAATPAAAKDLLMVLLSKLADTVPPLSESRLVPPLYSAALGCLISLSVCQGVLDKSILHDAPTAAAAASLHLCMTQPVPSVPVAAHTTGQQPVLNGTHHVDYPCCHVLGAHREATHPPIL